MFNNVGSKVKTLAKVVCWLGIIASVISGITLIAGGAQNGNVGGGFLAGVLTIALGAFVSWLGSLPTYAIGEAAENAEKNGCN